MEARDGLKMNKKESFLVSFINENLIMERKEFIKQYNNKQTNKTSYITIRRAITDQHLLRHIRKKITVGIKSGTYKTKFVAFDVDSGARGLRVLETVLKDQFSIAENEYFVVRSGKKGFHVYILFNTPISNKRVKIFYDRVINHVVKTMQIPKIELRPTPTMGIKLFEGLHLSTGVTMTICNKKTLRKISYKHLANVKKIAFPEAWGKYQAGEMEVLKQWRERQKKETLKLTGTIKSHSIIGNRYIAARMYKTKRMINKSYGRNHSIIKYVTYLRELGLSKAEILKECDLVLYNSVGMYKTPLEAAKKEVRDNYKYYAKYSYKVEVKKQIKIFQTEITYILKTIKTNPQRLLFFCLLLHSKRVNREKKRFYMSYRQMVDMGNTKNKTTIKKHLKALEQLGAINMYEKSFDQQYVNMEPNEFEINFSIPTGAFAIVTLTDIMDDQQPGSSETIDFELEFKNLTNTLLDQKQLKSLVSKKQYYEFFRT